MSRKIPDLVTSHELRLDALSRHEEGWVLWDVVFASPSPVRVEIGVGNSTFLIEVARNAPTFSYLGFEYSTKRVLKFLRKVEISGFTNIKMLCLDATRVLDWIFPPRSVDHFYINHPDPWPKRRHSKKRFVQESNAHCMLRALRPGGGISLRTDALAYAQQMLRVLDGIEGFENLSGGGSFAPGPLESFPTPYETKFRRSGRAIHYLEYRAK
ncbi:MAG TPA: tRNA (guanosine(46)-N7)-methyltransferase TrmB [Planctomycetota bacterium]|nr:tRNA (guanosine(46)-N7)-methyltransferase TrmB [Planctomycetota bacterium]